VLQITANVSGGHLNPAVGTHFVMSSCSASCWVTADCPLTCMRPCAGDLCNNDHGEASAPLHIHCTLRLLLGTIMSQSGCN
jgi:hypothetical protein